MPATGPTTRREYTLDLLGATYRYRGATRREVEEAVRLGSEEAGNAADAQIEVWLCRFCLLSPDPAQYDWENCLAGIPTRLAGAIREASGLSETSKDLFERQARAWYSTPAGEAESLMMAVFGLDLGAIQNLDPFDWFRTALAAQQLFLLQQQAQGGQAPQDANSAVVTPPGIARPKSAYGRREKQTQVMNQVQLGTM